jgi:hypothetical protein
MSSETRLFPSMLLLTVVTSGCSHSNPPNVRQFVEPRYPVMAQCNNREGVVDLVVQGGADGRVVAAMEEAGSGADRELIVGAISSKISIPLVSQCTLCVQAAGKADPGAYRAADRENYLAGPSRDNRGSL